jgi:hypothetical protein
MTKIMGLASAELQTERENRSFWLAARLYQVVASIVRDTQTPF